MKIAIVTFHNNISEHTIGGIATGPVYLKHTFSDVLGLCSPDIICIGKKGKYSGFLDEVNYVSYDKSSELLNKYDFIIFKSPGYTYEKYDESRKGSAYRSVLGNLNVPFAFMVNEERDRKIYPYCDEFINDDNLKFVIFNSVDMHKDFEDFTVKCNDYTEFNYYVPSNGLETIISRFKSKPNSVVSTARFNNRKRILEFTEISKDLSDKGFQVKIAGARQNYFYSQRVLSSNTEYWEDLGFYTPDKLPDIMSQCKFHYNFVYLKRKNRNVILRPRLEISTLEALKYGCLPIICKDTTPDWISDNSAIRVSSKDFSNIPEVLSSISDDEAIDRITNFYNEVNSNILPTIENIYNKINEVV